MKQARRLYENEGQRKPDVIQKPKGGDTRIAAARNGKRVGAPPKADSPYEVTISLRVTSETDSSLRAWANLEGVQRTDIARRAIEKWLRDNSFV